MKKGFTLIELLAVIIILAIIALITTPIILNVVSDARLSSFKDSIYGVIDASRLYYAQHQETANNIIFTVQDKQLKSGEQKLVLTGKIPDGGSVKLGIDGNISARFWDETVKKCAIKGPGETELLVRSINKDECLTDITDTNSLLPNYTQNGLVVHLDGKIPTVNETLPTNEWQDISLNGHNTISAIDPSYDKNHWVFNNSTTRFVLPQIITNTVLNQQTYSFEILFMPNELSERDVLMSGYDGGKSPVLIERNGLGSNGITRTAPMYPGKDKGLYRTITPAKKTSLLTLVYNGNGVTGYIDGTKTESISLGAYTSKTSLYPLSLGGDIRTDRLIPFGGNMYAFRFYSKALTDSEVMQNYNQDKTRYNL